MSLLSDILDNPPPYWTTSKNYGQKRYKMYCLAKNSQEFKEVADKFYINYPDEVVKTVRRVQHPYAFARYFLHKEYLKQLANVEESYQYDIIDECDLRDYLASNCDERTLTEDDPDDEVYVQRKFVFDNHLAERDSSSYPEYLITVEPYEEEEDDYDEEEEDEYYDEEEENEYYDEEEEDEYYDDIDEYY